MVTDRGSGPHADSSRSEPGSEAIASPETAQRSVVPILASIVAAQNGALDLLAVYVRQPDPKPAALIDDARTRLTLALEQLADLEP